MGSKSAKRSKARIEATMYLICIWVLLRAAMPIFGLIEQYNVNRAYLTILGPISAGSFPHWLLKFNQMGLVTILISLGFAACCIGLAMGRPWARLGVLVISVIAVLWNLRTVASGHNRAPFYSLVALGFTYWFFRQPAVLSSFGATDRSPSSLDRKILNVPLDLAFSICLLAALIVLEIVDMQQMGVR